LTERGTSETMLLKQLGARILSEANDLKRTPEVLAREMGREPEFVQSIIAGEQDRNTVRDFIWKMVETYPISMAELWMDIGDTMDGALIVRSSASLESARVFDRPDRTGAMSPYYEYRDTAMSAIAPFKPEWIKQLRQVEDADPYNPDVAFNNGHLMHQMTFFYWRGEFLLGSRR
jgi:hypothetical protein